MTWHQSSQRLLTLLIDGDPTPWVIMKFGLAEPYHYELWQGDKYHGRFDSAKAAAQAQEQLQ